MEVEYIIVSLFTILFRCSGMLVAKWSLSTFKHQVSLEATVTNWSNFFLSASCVHLKFICSIGIALDYLRRASTCTKDHFLLFSKAYSTRSFCKSSSYAWTYEFECFSIFHLHRLSLSTEWWKIWIQQKMRVWH